MTLFVVFDVYNRQQTLLNVTFQFLAYNNNMLFSQITKEGPSVVRLCKYLYIFWTGGLYTAFRMFMLYVVMYQLAALSQITLLQFHYDQIGRIHSRLQIGQRKRRHIHIFIKVTPLR